MVSQWLWGYTKIYGDTEFPEFVRRVYTGAYTNKPHLKHFYWYIPQIDWIRDKYGDIKVGGILRWENLQFEFNKMCHAWGLPIIELIKGVNSAESLRCFPRKPWEEYYNEECDTADIIRELYSEDFKVFGYDTHD